MLESCEVTLLTAQRLRLAHAGARGDASSALENHELVRMNDNDSFAGTKELFDFARVPAFDAIYVARIEACDTPTPFHAAAIDDSHEVTRPKAAENLRDSTRQQAVAIPQRGEGAIVDGETSRQLRLHAHPVNARRQRHG